MGKEEEYLKKIESALFRSTTVIQYNDVIVYTHVRTYV